mmetsp:Transcript_21020/g.32069  ORF Transcript_21020/g.32069 Transcript_21020/m.32069 type:complete len:286 (+) Transcript_21020:492-1349(+)
MPASYSHILTQKWRKSTVTHRNKVAKQRFFVNSSATYHHCLWRKSIDKTMSDYICAASSFDMITELQVASSIRDSTNKAYADVGKEVALESSPSTVLTRPFCILEPAEKKREFWKEDANAIETASEKNGKRLKPALKHTYGARSRPYFSAERPRTRSKCRRGFRIRQVTFAENTIFMNRRSCFKRPAVKKLFYEDKRSLFASRPDLSQAELIPPCVPSFPFWMKGMTTPAGLRDPNHHQCGNSKSPSKTIQSKKQTPYLMASGATKLGRSRRPESLYPKVSSFTR